jgi:glutamine amidotransferase
LHSIARALKHVGAETTVAAGARELEDADLLVLPGVGAFSEGMRGLRERGQHEALLRLVGAEGRPVLGVCLGCQMLFSSSEEFEGGEGLSLVPGQVLKIDSTEEPVPHVGWKRLRQVCTDRQRLPFPAVTEAVMVYFVHSYYCLPRSEAHVLATVQHGGAQLPAVLGRGNVFGFQFHPEKSGAAGLEMLRDFLKLAA